MNSKLNALRALAAYNAQLSLRFFTRFGQIVLAALFVITAVLAYFFSPWWWIFLLPTAVLLLVFVIALKIVRKIIHKLHRHPFTTRQREQLEKFTGQLKGLAEIKNTPVFVYAITSIWDLIRQRDETSIQKLIESSKSLKSEFAKLEKHFGER